MKWEREPASLHIRVDWSEIDYFGHVNTVIFFRIHSNLKPSLLGSYWFDGIS